MPERPICENCGVDFKSAASLSAHRRKIHNVYKRKPKKAPARKAPKSEDALTPPSLGANVKVMELALDPDENIVVVLSNGSARWRAVIFEAVK